jgi:hypothetical protein
MRIHGVVFSLLALSLSLLASSASAALLIRVDKSTQTLTVTRDGRTLHTWPVSTGRTGYATPSGSFITFRMEAEHFSKEWDDAPMPHSVFFTKQGHAIHGSFDTKRLGSPASHGCVRLAPGNAAKLFSLVQQEGLPNTQVVLSGSEQIALERRKSLPTANTAARAPDRLANAGDADGPQTPSGRPPRPPSLQLISDYALPGYARPRYVEPRPTPFARPYSARNRN